MEKYSLEVLNFETWELERDFSTYDGALRYGTERFQHNEWRIFDRISQSHVYTHDPLAVIEQDAQLEIQRFAETARWREIYRDRNFYIQGPSGGTTQFNPTIERRQQLRDVANRQRLELQAQTAARRARLRGFNFVGDPPRTLLFEDHIFVPSIMKKTHKVDWLQEGF